MNMSIVDPQSESEILRASTILLIALRSVSFGLPVKEPTGMTRRELSLQIVIEEVLKGEVQQHVNQPFALKVEQHLPRGLRVMDFYGIWSHAPVAEGARFVAFCQGDLADAAILLTDPYCEQLLTVKEALADTREALTLEAAGLSPAELLDRAPSLKSRHGTIFARYVTAKTKPNAMAPPPSIKSLALTADAESVSEPASEIFDGLMNLIEDPQTSPQARATYLTSVYEEMGMTAAPPQQQLFRLIQTLFKVLSIREAQPLHANIEEVYLPNLLGLHEGAAILQANEVFKDKFEELQQALSALKSGQQGHLTPRLIQWLEAESE